MEPSPFVTQYNADVARFHSMICQHLRPSAYALLFDTIPELVAHHLIHKLPHIPNQCINSIGIKQLRRNLFALQQVSWGCVEGDGMPWGCTAVEDGRCMLPTPVWRAPTPFGWDGGRHVTPYHPAQSVSWGTCGTT